MLFPILVFLVVYFFIATEIIDKTIAALIGAGLMIGFHFIGYEEALHAIDMNVLFLLIGMMIVVNTLTDTGVFEWLAIKLARLAKGNGLVLAVFFMILTAVLSAFLDNVTTVILMAPITILLCQLLEIPAVPILIMEAIFSNIGGAATLVGDPPNILIGSQTHLSFNDFLLNMSPPALVCIVVLLAVTVLMFCKTIKTTEQTRKRIEQSRPEKAILQPVVLKKALIVFGFILAGFFGGRVLGIEPGIIALVGAMVMFAFSLGVAIPFLLAAVFLIRTLPLLTRIQRLAPWIGFVSMITIVAFGLILITDNFHTLSDFIYPYLGLN